jgi:hypothetical protein
MKYEIVTDEIYENVEKGIGSTTCSIAKCLDRHDLFKRRVKNINE